MAPKTRSQGGASPALELQAAAPRTRARKPKTFKHNSALSPVASVSGRPTETAVATSRITKASPLPSPTASSPLTPLSPQQLWHSKSSRSAGWTHTRRFRASKEVERAIKEKSSSPELHHPRCCGHGHRYPFDLNGVPLVAPSTVHAQPNYQDALTQTFVNEPPESGLTVQPAQTPVKRTREESAGAIGAEPTAKRHQANHNQPSLHSSTATRTSVPPSAPATTHSSTKPSIPGRSSTTTGKQAAWTPAPNTPKRTTMASIAQAKSRTKSPRSSPVSRPKVDSLQITSNMTWGQMTRVHARRAKLAASREHQIQSVQDEDLLHKESRQASPPAADQAPTTPHTAPQPRTGLFGSIRKALDFVPQLPTSVTKTIFSNPFAITTRLPPALDPHPAHPPSPHKPATNMEVDSARKTREEEHNGGRPPPPRIQAALPPKVRASSSASPVKPARANTGVATIDADTAKDTAEATTNTSHNDANAGQDDAETRPSSQKRKRNGYGLYFEGPDYNSEDSSDPGSLDDGSPAPDAKKRKLDEAQTPRSVLKKRTGNGLSTRPRISKRVTFDDSPRDTPSKMRNRSFEYTGTTFADAPRQSYTSPSADDDINLFNSPGTKANTEANTPFYYEPPKYPSLPEDYVVPADFTPTSANPRPGTFCLDFNTYDENDDDIDWDAPIETVHSNLVIGDPDTPTAIQTSTVNVDDLATPPARESPPATPRIAHAELPATSSASTGINIHADIDAGPFPPPHAADANVLADVTQEQINKVRSTVEQHKSKNPSRLSQVERATSASPPAGEEANEFEADWPQPKTYVEAGVCSQRIFDLVTKGWDPRDSVIGEMVYEQDLKEWIDAHRLEKEKGIPIRYNLGDEEGDE